MSLSTVLSGLLVLSLAIPAIFWETPTIGTALSPDQIRQEVRRVVCDSFGYISYSASKDTEDTVLQIRKHNAAYGSFKCGN